jgi:hypothetical protein
MDTNGKVAKRTKRSEFLRGAAPRRRETSRTMIDLEKSLTVLLDAGVEFVLIGGAAMVVQGGSRPTRDVDVCYSRSPENVKKLAAALAPFHPKLRGAPEGLPFRFDPETLRSGLNFTLSTDLGDLDLLGEVAGLGFYPAVCDASEVLTLFDRDCRVLSVEGLIRAKRAAGRPRDLEVLPELEALSEARQKTRRGGNIPERK